MTPFLTFVGAVLFSPLLLYALMFDGEQEAFHIDSKPWATGFSESESSKSVLIVGAGSAGLAALKSLLDLPLHVRTSWTITLYEQRHNIGGVWLPDVNEPHPPDLPETPLYPSLRTNTAQPTMAFPGFPFPPLTPLFPGHEYVLQYLIDYANHYNLLPYIQCNMAVTSAAWIGDSASGKWNVTILDKGMNSTSQKSFDHIISATGINRYPRTPSWKGQSDWLEAKQEREIIHTVYWRNSTKYEGKTVLVVGLGASARDAVLQSAPIANKIYLSMRSGMLPERIKEKVIQKPAISHFTENTIVFADGTEIDDVDAVILATGYEVRVPFLIESGALRVSRDITSNQDDKNPHAIPSHLTTNLRYIYPLHKHIFPLVSSFPPRALAFVGLPVWTACVFTDIAQSLLVAHTLANETILPSQADMLGQLREHEASLRARGVDPYVFGHSLINPEFRGGPDAPGGQQPRELSHDYQEGLVAFLKEQGALPDDGKPFVAAWRREGREKLPLLRKAWDRIEGQGEKEVEKCLKGVRTEEDWGNLIMRLIESEKKEWGA